MRMKLYFLRHATAEDNALSDAARELTSEGEAEARIAGKALARLNVKPTRILTSPLVRAHQTAELVAKALKFTGKIEAIDSLQNRASTEMLIEALLSHGDDDEIVLVGHMPSLSVHVAAMIGASVPDALPFDKGGIACVEMQRMQLRKGELRWLARQKQLRLMAA
jgi:phosphohistidine phosphatase